MLNIIFNKIVILPIFVLLNTSKNLFIIDSYLPLILIIVLLENM